jgi:hypothetical protein
MPQKFVLLQMDNQVQESMDCSSKINKNSLSYQSKGQIKIKFN